MTARSLRQLREWLTLHEAASELSEALGESVSDADVLRLTIDEHLRLSLYLPTKLRAYCQHIDEEGLDPEETEQLIEGLCDVAMFGRTKRQVEHDYQWLCGNFVPKGKPLGAHVEKGVLLCRLPPDEGATGFSPRPASEFPQGSRVCIRRAALEDYIGQLARRGTLASTAPQETELLRNELGTRERATLLTVIAALAKEARIDVSKASKAGVTISNLISAMGLEVAPNTVARHLRNLAKMFPELKSDHSD